MSHQLLLLAAMLAGAQPDAGPADDQRETACDSARLAAVGFLRGSWLVRSHEPGRAPHPERTGIATVSPVAGRCAFQEKLRLDDGFEEVRILAFDHRTSAWQLVVVDSDHGNVVVMHGHSSRDGLEFISTHQRPDRVLVDRVQIRRTATGWVWRTETASGYGAPWRLIQEITYVPGPCHPASAYIFASNTPLSAIQPPTNPARTANEIDRLVGLARVWGRVKYFHPTLAYRPGIDWDSALVATIPRRRSAGSGPV